MKGKKVWIGFDKQAKRPGILRLMADWRQSEKIS